MYCKRIKKRIKGNLKSKPSPLAVGRHQFLQCSMLLDLELNNIAVLTHHLVDWGGHLSCIKILTKFLLKSTLRLMCSGFAAAPSSPAGLLSPDSALAMLQTRNSRSKSGTLYKVVSACLIYISERKWQSRKPEIKSVPQIINIQNPSQICH